MTIKSKRTKLDWPGIVAENRERIWRIAYRLLGNHTDASDCFQEAFVAALNISRREKVRNWTGLLGQLATRKALDLLRSRLRQKSRQDGLADWQAVSCPNTGPSQQAEAAELAARLRRELAELPVPQAEVFCLHCIDGQSYSEVAMLLNLSTSNVGVLLHRARQQLRERLADCAADKRSRNTEVHDE